MDESLTPTIFLFISTMTYAVPYNTSGIHPSATTGPADQDGTRGCAKYLIAQAPASQIVFVVRQKAKVEKSRTEIHRPVGPDAASECSVTYVKRTRGAMIA